MSAEKPQLLVCDRTLPKTCVVRFVHPDMREYLYDAESIAECALFKEVCGSAMGEAGAGAALILNLGLIDPFPTAFYRFLLRLNEEANFRFLICCLPKYGKEAFDLMNGARDFAGQVFESESGAAYAAAHPS